jgi:hypothetical protein
METIQGLRSRQCGGASHSKVSPLQWPVCMQARRILTCCRSVGCTFTVKAWWQHRGALGGVHTALLCHCKEDTVVQTQRSAYTFHLVHKRLWRCLLPRKYPVPASSTTLDRDKSLRQDSPDRTREGHTGSHYMTQAPKALSCHLTRL